MLSGLFFWMLYTLVITLSFPTLFPFLSLMYAAPFLILCIYRTDKKSCLWMAFIFGFLIDLFSTETRLGFYASNYLMTVWFIYPMRQYFFEEHDSTLPIMTFAFSICSTLIQALQLYVLGEGIILTWMWFRTDVLFYSLCDALYAFLGFTLISTFFRQIKLWKRRNS